MKKVFSKLSAVLLVAIILFGCNGSKNSADAVELKLNVEKGKKIDYMLQTHFDMNMDMMGQKIVTGGDVDYGYNLVVDDVNAEGDRMMNATIGSVKFKVNSMGMSMGYDSKNPGDSTKENPMDGMFRKMFGSMIGNSFKMTISQKGEIKNISGVEEMLDKMVERMPGSDEEKLKIKTQMQQSFNPQQIKESFGQGFNVYPDKPIKTGDSWTKNGTMGVSGMRSNMAITYTVKEIKTDEVLLDLKGKITSAANAVTDSTSAAKPSADLTGDQTGTMTINRGTGLVTSAKMEMKMKGNITVQGTKAPMDMKANVTIESK